MSNRLSNIRSITFSLLIVGIFIAVFSMANVREAYAATRPIRVPANVEWVSTRMFVAEGIEVHLITKGVAITAPPATYPDSRSGPEGQVWGLGCGQFEEAPPPCALDDAPYGALIGRVGPSGAPFLIGGASSFIPPDSGRLYLVVNDNLGFYSDNLAGFTVLFAED